MTDPNSTEDVEPKKNIEESTETETFLKDPEKFGEDIDDRKKSVLSIENVEKLLSRNTNDANAITVKKIVISVLIFCVFGVVLVAAIFFSTHEIISNHNNTMEYDYDPEGPYGPFDNITIDYDDYDEIGHTEILSGINSVITGSNTFCEGIAIFKKNDGTEKSFVLPKPKVTKWKINRMRYFKIGKQGRDIAHITLNGNCCVKISEMTKHRGNNQFLGNGFDDTPNFYNIRSMAFGFCEDLKTFKKLSR